jgi:2-dehydro-3-deoxyphosphogluconate aldolase/(4S)-4-hydroxy-2-oxoglutarate aldolase
LIQRFLSARKKPEMATSSLKLAMNGPILLKGRKMLETTQQIIERVGLIPVLRAKSVAQGRSVVDAMIAGGVTVVEVTMTVPGAIDLLKELRNEYGPKDILLGSGTVTTAEQAQATIDAGAEFVVSPSLHPEVISVTKANKKISCPGALTPTEAITAWNAGADYVKIFPCSAVGGASYLKSLLAPFPHLKIIPTGGVTLQSAESFIKAGARALGVGSDLVNLAAIDAGHPETITETARAYLKVIADARKN